MLDVLGSDYLRTASAKGLTQRQTFYKHGLRTALIPMTVWFAFAFGTLVVGATFTEKIFAWQGMALRDDAADRRDQVGMAQRHLGRLSLSLRGEQLAARRFHRRT